MQYLLKHRADPRLRDKRGFTAIHYAVAGGNQPALEALLDACPPGNLTISSESAEKAETPLPALTPLHLAVRLRELSRLNIRFQLGPVISFQLLTFLGLSRA